MNSSAFPSSFLQYELQLHDALRDLSYERRVSPPEPDLKIALDAYHAKESVEETARRILDDTTNRISSDEDETGSLF